MKRQLLHTPEGVRDIYNDECEKKLILQDELLKVQKQYGYHPIQTPTFEFFDTFGREIGTTPSKYVGTSTGYYTFHCAMCRNVFW